MGIVFQLVANLGLKPSSSVGRRDRDASSSLKQEI
jgi:hypothetical protein